MKKLYILTLAALTCTAATSQVFSSDVSDWTAGTPDDFMGSKTHTSNLTITEVMTGADFGTSIAQLETSGTSHRRFTTQPLSVVDQQGYEIKVYAKGDGEMRFGLFDDNAGGTTGGYASYSAYQTVSGTMNSVYSAQIQATNTSSIAEFIISVRNTVAPTHIQIDSVSIEMITIAPPTGVSVYDIQYSTATPADSPYTGQVVSTGGIVTYVRGDGKFYIQSGSGAYSGIYVFDDSETVAIGDSITCNAEVDEYFELTELKNMTNFVNVSSGNFFMSSAVTTADMGTEAYEGVLISTCGTVNNVDQFDNFTFNDGTGDAVGDPYIAGFHSSGSNINAPTVGTTVIVKGIVDYSFSEFKVVPRSAGDVAATSQCLVSIEENVTVFNMYPNPTEGVLNVEVEGNNFISIADARGSIVRSFQSNDFTSIDISDLASGMYFLKVNNTTKRFAVK